MMAHELGFRCLNKFASPEHICVGVAGQRATARTDRNTAVRLRMALELGWEPNDRIFVFLIDTFYYISWHMNYPTHHA